MVANHELGSSNLSKYGNKTMTYRFCAIITLLYQNE